VAAPGLGGLRERARRLRREVVALWFAYRDPDTPVAARLLAMVIVAYALSPIDLIPDFIPVLGFLDEVILLPGLIYLTIKLIPAHVMERSRENAAAWLGRAGTRWANWAAAGAIVLIWMALLWLAWRMLTPVLPD
jgi:uncharacterized membrane protein YkvA (DUF1232 family)